MTLRKKPTYLMMVVDSAAGGCLSGKASERISADDSEDLPEIVDMHFPAEDLPQHRAA
jgi:hypothetical protein